MRHTVTIPDFSNHPRFNQNKNSKNREEIEEIASRNFGNVQKGSLTLPEKQFARNDGSSLGRKSTAVSETNYSEIVIDETNLQNLDVEINEELINEQLNSFRSHPNTQPVSPSKSNESFSQCSTVQLN